MVKIQRKIPEARGDARRSSALSHHRNCGVALPVGTLQSVVSPEQGPVPIVGSDGCHIERVMTDEHSQDQREHADLLQRHREVSETLRHAMLALLAFSLFCWLTVGAPDRSLVISEPTIKVPFADVPVTFVAFLVVAPLILVALAVYLHVFEGVRLRTEAELGDPPGNKLLATLFNFDHPTARFLTTAIFYWQVPLTLGAITYKALAGPEWGVPMLVLTVIVTGILVCVRSLRMQGGALRKTTIGLYYGLIAIMIGVIMTIALKVPAAVTRPLNLFRADLSHAWLPSASLRYADLYEANLSDANLQSAYLSDADLRRANLNGANLSYAKLSGADLSGANLSGTNLNGANLSDAVLSGVDLSGVDLSGVDLSGVDLSDADLGELT